MQRRYNTEMPNALIEFRDVTCRIGGHEVLRGFNLSVFEGETMVLLGRSGSGKTTVLKLINGLLRPSSGAVLVDGHRTTEQDPIRLRRRIGYVIQETGLFPHFTVRRNVGLVPQLEGWPPERIDARVAELLNMLELPAERFEARYPRELSGGQRQRVGIARALAADPRLLLFDEPFGALDPVTRAEAQRMFQRLSGQLHKTAVFVTHDVREALALADRIALLREGTLELIATPREFRASNATEAQAFLGSLN
jgi:osmoprotectant transport system ATP-binding protein